MQPQSRCGCAPASSRSRARRAIVCEEEARDLGDRGATDHPRPRRLRPPGRVPRLDAARRAHGRRRADARQDPARASRASGSCSPAAARLRSRSRRSSTTTAPTSRSSARPGPPPGPGDVARRCSARPRATSRCCAMRSATGTSSCARAIPLRYRRIVVAAEGDGRVEAVVHAAVDRDWRVIPGTEERVACDTLCLGYGFLPSVELLRLAGCALDEDEDRGGAVARLDDWMRTTVAGHLTPPATAPASRARWSRSTRAGSPALGAALDLGALSAQAESRWRLPLRRRLCAAAAAFRAALSRMHRVGRRDLRALDRRHGHLPLRGGHARSRSSRRIAASARPRCREGPDPRGHGAVPGPQLPAARSPRLIAQRHGVRDRRRDRRRPRGCPPDRSRSARSPTTSIEDHGFFTDRRRTTLLMRARAARGCR